MSESCNIPHPLKREGTTQQERFPEALQNGYVNIDEQGIKEMVELSHAFAKYVSFYPSAGGAPVNWQPFFQELLPLVHAPENYVNGQFDFSRLEKLQQTQPHAALFLSFLRLMGAAKDNINELSQKHIDFYYKDMLRLKEKNAVPDKAAVFFELEKGVKEKILPAGTEFMAGKDNVGKDLYYKLITDTVVNTAKVSSVKTFFAQKDNAGKIKGLYAESQDENNEAGNSWITFGDEGDPDTDFGFVISSPAFQLSEGTRIITFNRTGMPAVPSALIKAEYTAEKKWENASTVLSEAGSITVTVNDNAPAFSNYDPEKHKGNYPVAMPLIKIRFLNPGQAGAAHSYENLKEIKLDSSNCFVKVEVKGVKKLHVENDYGALEVAKPFMPFGATPSLGDSCYIGYPLAFNNKFQSCTLSYTLTGVTGDIEDIAQIEGFSPYYAYKPEIEWRGIIHGMVSTKRPATQGDDRSILSLNNTQILFSGDITSEQETLGPASKSGFLKLTLKDEHLDFEDYLAKFTYAVTNQNNAALNPKPVVPNKPPVPKLADLSLDYVLRLNKADLNFFHLHPFGFDEMKADEFTLLPQIEDEGSLYIGLENAKTPALINLYFQVQEDSGDVNKAIDGIRWYSLANNNWQQLESVQVLADGTQRLLQSGVISFNLLPETANTTHSILNNNLHWLKAAVSKDTAAYPLLKSIKAQAGLVMFDNRNNDPERLASPLAPNLISKFLNKPDGFKSVTQPFESFGGKMKENSQQFYTRISERLRHKQRAWNIWDYERIILENFPFIYKVKCISHTKEEHEFRPGHVTIIVIPNLTNTSTYNKLEPRISVGNLQKISDFINRYQSPFAKIKVQNPDYDKIKVEADLMMRPEYNDQFYALEIKKVITEYLAPWINNGGSRLTFSGTVHASSIINLIDESKYVDYISSFRMIKLNSADDDLAPGIEGTEFFTEKEYNILTSADQHIININKPC